LLLVILALFCLYSHLSLQQTSTPVSQIRLVHKHRLLDDHDLVVPNSRLVSTRILGGGDFLDAFSLPQAMILQFGGRVGSIT
jgi:hypothetical protein